MADARTHVSGMLSFAAGIIAAREQVRFEMASGGGIVLREEAIADLPGIAFGGDDAWMRLTRMREAAPPALLERFEGWIEGALSNPETLPRLCEDRIVQVSIETASDIVEAELAAPDACFPVEEVDPVTGEVGVNGGGKPATGRRNNLPLGMLS
jgi:hypothetical protein